MIDANHPIHPPVIAGPMLRHCTKQRVVLWMAVRECTRLRVRLAPHNATALEFVLAPNDAGCTWLQAGRYLHYVLIDLHLPVALPADEWVGYSVALERTDSPEPTWRDEQDWAPNLCYPGQSTPGFVLPSRIHRLLHGSCRKPHHAGADGLVEADRIVHDCVQGLTPITEWPSVLMMTGDQVYTDDVAGPMLQAMHEVIEALGLPNEALPGTAEVRDAAALYTHRHTFYQRERLLPNTPRDFDLIEVLFGGVEKPVFTTDSAHNHLISLAEMLTMYLMVWSAEAWKLVSWRTPAGLSAKEAALFERETQALQAFVQGLPQVRRVLAHVPTAMIFDDHDITDDWNLSREWEEVAYGHPFSKRVIGNALMAYWIHQGWGNRPECMDAERLPLLRQVLQAPGQPDHDALIDGLLRYREWHYTWPTQPPLVVVDTRTHRWRAESAARKPSGLMDWEALTDLQQTLKGHKAVVLVTPAPIFGVKLIESIQRVFTWLGRPLMVDAENWMAHPGAGHAIQNIFRHPQTPQHFVVLSGDVHYSFVYDVELRGHRRGPDIWQICSSGLRNTFPARLLDTLDVLNRWLYSPRSPLNWLTRRRHMRVTPRKPEGIAHGRRLLNGSGVGCVELDADGVPWRISQYLDNGRCVRFVKRDAEARWD